MSEAKEKAEDLRYGRFFSFRNQQQTLASVTLRSVYRPQQKFLIELQSDREYFLRLRVYVNGQGRKGWFYENFHIGGVGFGAVEIFSHPNASRTAEQDDIGEEKGLLAVLFRLPIVPSPGYDPTFPQGKIRKFTRSNRTSMRSRSCKSIRLDKAGFGYPC
jgi:hypothetical protein